MTPKFVYESYSIEGNTLKFNYSACLPAGRPLHRFTHTVTFENLTGQIDPNLVFQLGLAEMFSYWKLFCSPVIEVRAGRLARASAMVRIRFGGEGRIGGLVVVDGLVGPAQGRRQSAVGNTLGVDQLVRAFPGAVGEIGEEGDHDAGQRGGGPSPIASSTLFPRVDRELEGHLRGRV